MHYKYRHKIFVPKVTELYISESTEFINEINMSLFSGLPNNFLNAKSTLGFNLHIKNTPLFHSFHSSLLYFNFIKQRIKIPYTIYKIDLKIKSVNTVFLASV